MKKLHDPGNQTHDLMHTARLSIPLHNKQSCCISILHGISISKPELGLYVTCWMVSDVQRGSRRTDPAGHDIDGQGRPLALDAGTGTGSVRLLASAMLAAAAMS